MDEMPIDRSSRLMTGSGLIVFLSALSALAMIFLVAPTEATMGDVQRILYLHVSVAWCGLIGAVAMGLCGAMYLMRRRLEWDFWSQSAGEVGWLCATLTLTTGSLWAHEAWGTWWTWEPRLTSSLVLWMMYSGIILLRSTVEDPNRRARIAAVLAMICLCDVPLVLMATRWFRGVHPVSPDMDPQMRLVLLVSVASFTALFVYLVTLRRRHLKILELEAETKMHVQFATSLSLHDAG
jgi:heme exporter protein C